MLRANGFFFEEMAALLSLRCLDLDVEVPARIRIMHKDVDCLGVAECD